MIVVNVVINATLTLNKYFIYQKLQTSVVSVCRKHIHIYFLVHIDLSPNVRSANYA